MTKLSPFVRSCHLAACSLVAAGCADCGDANGAPFFEPESYGTYVFVETPELNTPRLLDFGAVAPGNQREQELVLHSVGRLPVQIDGITVTDSRFEALTGTLEENPELDPGELRRVGVVFTAADGTAVRESLTVSSNDADEPRQEVLLIANRTTPCVGGFEPGEPTWQVHEGDGPACWDDVEPRHGASTAYRHASVPAADAPGWVFDPNNHIAFERRSTLCGTDCACLGGGDFTYFQTFVYVPANATLDSFVVDIDDVDDGARITVYNERYPEGVTREESYARLPGGSSADLGPDFVAGTNRIVITHVDDCCSLSRIRNVTVRTSTGELDRCGDL